MLPSGTAGPGMKVSRLLDVGVRGTAEVRVGQERGELADELPRDLPRHPVLRDLLRGLEPTEDLVELALALLLRQAGSGGRDRLLGAAKCANEFLADLDEGRRGRFALRFHGGHRRREGAGRVKGRGRLLAAWPPPPSPRLDVRRPLGAVPREPDGPPPDVPRRRGGRRGQGRPLKYRHRIPRGNVGPRLLDLPRPWRARSGGGVGQPPGGGSVLAVREALRPGGGLRPPASGDPRAGPRGRGGAGGEPGGAPGPGLPSVPRGVRWGRGG